MNKYLLGIILSSVVLCGCQKNAIVPIDVHTITDLATLQQVITQVSTEMNKGTLDIIKAEDLVNQLQQKYVDLTANAQPAIETQFADIQKIFDQQAVKSYTLPLWAKRLGMIEPQGMNIDKTISQQNYITSGGYESVILVYTGAYQEALQQAKLIAEKAHLHVDKAFQKAQSIAKIGDIQYISGLDVGNITQGIVYVNHDLTDTNVDYVLSVSVDQNGMLTLEATNYMQTFPIK